MGSASELVIRIGSLLDDLQAVADLVGHTLDLGSDLLLFSFRHCKITLISAKKLGDDPNFGSFLHMLEVNVCGVEQVIRNLRLVYSGLAIVEQLGDDDFDFDIDLGSLMEPMGQLYSTLLDPSSQFVNTLTAVEVADLFGSVMKNLLLFLTLDSDLNVETLEETMKALGEQMLFLDNLRLFASSAPADSIADEHFWAHIESVSIRVAFLLHNCQGSSEDSLLGISELMKNIKPIDSQVSEAYCEILRCSKPRRRLLAPADRDMDLEGNYAKGFIDSLRSYLLEMLQLDTHDVVSSMKDQLQELFQGLGSMTVILSQQPNNYDFNIYDNIFDVVCDAGILICSLYQRHMRLHHDLQDLLEAIRLIVADSEEKAAPKREFNKVPTTAPLSFVDFLLEKLNELTSCEVKINTMSHAHAIKEELLTLRSFLAEILELREEQEGFQALRDQILELVYRAEHVIDYLKVGDLSDSFSISFDSIIKDMKNVKLEFEVQESEMKMKEPTPTLHYLPSGPFQRAPPLENEVVGYLKEAEIIKNRLMRGSKNLRVVAIVGMPGQGKTTLAAKVYNDPSFSCYFAVRAQTVVSQIVDKRRVLLDLLGQIDPDKCSGITSDNDLVQKMWRSLKGRRYFIFLDDIWEAEAWGNLKEAFPEDHTASRIMFTSRHRDVAPNEEPHELRPFTEEESMDLLQRKLFPGSGWPTELVNLGIEIAQICKGLPLTILIVAGILAAIEPNGWKKILGGLGSGTVSSTEQCRNTLELSYSHLPEHLRPCFLSLATFPEDEEVPVRRLLRLWIAEGFIRKDEMKRIEGVAQEYFRDLFARSLLTVARQNSLGEVKSCRVHDLLHEFCRQKAKDELFFSFSGEIDKALEFQAPLQYLRRLCINSDPKLLIRSNEFFPHVRSLNFSYYVRGVPPNLSFMFHMCKALRVLDLEQLNLGRAFPSEIGLLVQLAFLAIGGCMVDIPPSIGNLYNLETLILNQLRGDLTLSLPDSFWNLQKLRHLHMTSQGGVFPIGNLYNSSDLCEMDWLSGLAIHYPCDLDGLLKKFPNIRKLKCTLLKSEDMVRNYVKIVVPDFLCQLESLSISLSYDGVTRSEFSLPANLKKLTLSSFPVSSWGLSTISRLSNLEVLKLDNVTFEGHTWDMEEAKFPKLRFLQLSSWGLISWIASDDQLDCLEKLVLLRCGYLYEMPSCLESISTLEVIEVRYCSNCVLELVGMIKEVREDNGNSELKIINVRCG